MDDCDDLLADLHRQTHEQVELAMIAAAAPVAAMHLDLAMLGAERTRIAEDLCQEE